MKFSLFKFIDEFILPAVLVTAARYLGVFVASFFLPIQFEVSASWQRLSLPFIQFGQDNEFVLANSVSWSFVAAVMAVSFGFVLFRIALFSEDRLHPRHARLLHTKNLDFLIIDPREATHQAFSWGFAALLVLTLSISDFLNALVGLAPFGLVVGVTAALLITLLSSLAQDLSLSR